MANMTQKWKAQRITFFLYIQGRGAGVHPDNEQRPPIEASNGCWPASRTQMVELPVL